MDFSKVCRVCAETGVLLELFGSKTQTVSYAEDVNKCLSLETSKGDGLPSHICVSCVGAINECLRFVNKLKSLSGDKQSHRRRGSTDSSKSKCCYFCESTENHLFPLSEASVNKTNDCFSVKVSDKETICYRCQFCLDTVHDLKLKACTSLKKFYSNSFSVKEVEKTSNKKTESVGEIVKTLKNKFNVDKNSMLPKVVKVTVVDFAVVIGSDILAKGSINVNEFMQLFQPSSLKNGEISSGAKKKARQSSLKQETKQEVSDSDTFKPPGPKSARPGPKRHQKVTFDIKSSSLPKDFGDSEVSTSTPNVPSKKKRSRMVSDSDDEKPSKKTCLPSESPNSPSSTTSLKTDSPRQTRRNSISPEKDDRVEDNISISKDETIPETVKPPTKKNSPRPKSKKTTKKESSSSMEKLDQIDSLVQNDTSQENVSENSQVEESEKSSKRKRARKNDGNYSKFFGEDSPSPPAKIQRKRRDSEEKDFFSSKGKKKQWKSSVSDGSEVDDPSSSMNESQVVEQPDFLKELDDLLRNTPKSTFRPFICSVCREGYVSTVKGMLHKLVVHDPHSNILLKLTRCDDDGEMEKLKEIIFFRFGSTAAAETSDVQSNVALNNDDGAVSDDDLFPDIQAKSAKKAVSKDLFEDLVSSTSYHNISETPAEEPQTTSKEPETATADPEGTVDKPESTASEHEDVAGCEETMETSYEKGADEDKSKGVNKGDLTSETVEDDHTEKTEEDKRKDDSVENENDVIQNKEDGTDFENCENVENSFGNLDPSNKTQEEQSTDEKEKGKVPEDAASIEDQSRNQDEMLKVNEDKEDPSGVPEEAESEKEEESESTEKDIVESESKLPDNDEEPNVCESDVKEKASVESDSEIESAKVSEDSDSTNNHEGKGISEIQDDGLSSEKTDNSPQCEDSDINKDVIEDGESVNQKHVEESENSKGNLEDERLVHDEHKSQSETEKEERDERAPEEARCEGILVGVN